MFVPSQSTFDIDTSLDSFDSNTQISDITLTSEEIAECLYNLNVSKTSGPNGIPARILKECSYQIAPSLCDLFKHPLLSGAFPRNGNQLMLHQFTRKNEKNPLKTTDRLHCCLSYIKFNFRTLYFQTTLRSHRPSHHTITARFSPKSLLHHSIAPLSLSSPSFCCSVSQKKFKQILYIWISPKLLTPWIIKYC